MAEGTFGTAINCMDGRMQQPIIDWMKKEFGFDYIDMITEPGPDKILAEGTDEQKAIVKHKVDISVNKHGSNVIIITGHDGCAGKHTAPRYSRSLRYSPGIHRTRHVRPGSRTVCRR